MENRNPNCECSECAKPIYRRPSELKHTGGLAYCSATCSNKRNKKPDLKCRVCDVIIPRRRRALTCSRACANIHRTGISYNVGRPRDKSISHRRLKTLLLKIRPNKCNRCPFDFVPVLQAHHIVEVCNGGTDDPENLELLCPNCHCTHHYLTRTKMKDASYIPYD